MLRLAVVKPCAQALRIARSADLDLDFTNGVDWTHPASGSQVKALLEPSYRLVGCGLGLKGQGCVLPHVDDHALSCFWLTSGSDVHIMLAKTGFTVEQASLSVGQVVVFDSRIMHALVARRRWSALVQQVQRRK